MMVNSEWRIRQMTPGQRMQIFDSLPARYRATANEYGLARALCELADDEEIAAFERDHAA